MGQVNDPTALVGDFKNLYKTSGLINAIPSWFIVQDRYPFEEAEAGTGAFYVFGVILQKEAGFTYAPSSGTAALAQSIIEQSFCRLHWTGPSARLCHLLALSALVRCRC